MTRDAFSKYHPLTNFLFFVGAIGFGMLIQHPAYLAVSAVSATVYYVLLNGRKGLKLLLSMIPLFLFLTFLNPLFNTRGDTVLFLIFGRPYTLEALYYGAAVAGVFVNMIIWFGCYNQVLTNDKFTSLFGSVIPSISLLLVMVFRMVPNFLRKAGQITNARKAIGKAVTTAASRKEQVVEGGALLGALTNWALEGGIITGDSMRARGYGTARRSSFMIYRMNAANGIVLAVMGVLAAIVICGMVAGQTSAEFTPAPVIAPVSGASLPALLAYGIFLLIPTILHGKEALQWHISRSRI